MTDRESEDLSNLETIKLQFEEVLELFNQLWKTMDAIKIKLQRKKSNLQPAQKQKLELQQLIFKVFLQYHFDVIGHKLIYYNIKYAENSLEITFDGKYVPVTQENPVKNLQEKALESETEEAVVFPVYFLPDESKSDKDSVDSGPECGADPPEKSEFSKIRTIGRVEYVLSDLIF